MNYIPLFVSSFSSDKNIFLFPYSGKGDGFNETFFFTSDFKFFYSVLLILSFCSILEFQALINFSVTSMVFGGRSNIGMSCLQYYIFVDLSDVWKI